MLPLTSVLQFPSFNPLPSTITRHVAIRDALLGLVLQGRLRTIPIASRVLLKIRVKEPLVYLAIAATVAIGEVFYYELVVVTNSSSFSSK